MSVPEDKVNFIPADLFFPSVPTFEKPTQALSVVSSDSVKRTDPLRYAAHVTLQGVGGRSNSHCLVQFVTPQIWRIRYDPTFSDVSQYPDANSRTIVENSFAELVDHLQDEVRDSHAWNSYLPDTTNWFWKTRFEQKAANHWILSSVDYLNESSEGIINTRLHFFGNPFRIVATRALQPLSADPDAINELGITTSVEQIIWQTTSQAFSFSGDPNIKVINNTVMNIKRPGSSQYLGFGEQGGHTVLKKPTYMNYFCYDNYNYKKVYNQGALDTREPLYHTTPFYLEMNNTPGYGNVTGLMIDNYSQVAIDLGKTNSGTIAVATRFGTFDAYILSADDVPKMIWQYTSIVGRPKIKPRFILGHHQACYGYTNSGQVEGVVNQYRQSGIPLDGMHLDVDFQNAYRTFTVDEGQGRPFANPSKLLQGLRARGVKTCTNITPILTLRESDDDPYHTLREFWDMKDPKNPATNLLVIDRRYPDGLPRDQPECVSYDGGHLTYIDPNNVDQRTSYKDHWNDPDSATYQDKYVFRSGNQGNYNSGYPFHGGVSYGPNLGTPGYYPDLNRAVARDKWGEQYQYLFDQGLEFVWQDMTTPAVANCYGDMLGFPARLMMSDDVYGQDPSIRPNAKTAIELWSLYSYNLHKATYRGLNRLKGRENKRNFIIGRGSQTGMHRFAGLWTGDNGSSWNFWRISVAQVLALGYSGLTIAGVDMGGFSRDPDSNFSPPRWCDPELLIRWYTGAFLLPWYRNHYHHHFQEKEFQEPWNYTTAYQRYQIPDNLRGLYASVEPICRYYVQLRYTLMQVLYDAMFANLIHGLPIARSMLITDPQDTSLFNESARFIDNQYLLGHNILVCPITDPSISTRDVYLPQNDTWYASNLRVNIEGYGPDPLMHAAGLGAPVPGGTTLSFYCPVPDAGAHRDQIAYVTPVYIRAGAIIPQIDVRQSIDERDLNPPCIHIYPGTTPTWYKMYLDDGVSRDSAPKDLPQYKYSHKLDVQDIEGETATQENEAKSKYREVHITQTYVSSTTRLVTLSHPWNGYDASPNIGNTYNLAIWAPGTFDNPPKYPAAPSFSFQDQDGKPVSDPGLTGKYDTVRGVLSVSIPCSLVPSLNGPSVVNGEATGPSRVIGVKVDGLN